MKIALLCSVAAVTLACSGTEPGPLRLTMSIDRSSVAMDDSLRVSLTLANVSPQQVMVYPETAYGACVDAFEVFDAAGRQSSSHVACAAVLLIAPTPVPLAPGATLRISDWWHPERSRIEGQSITPGDYRIRGAAVGDDEILRTGFTEIVVTP
jgi:hypothetical protein